MNIHLKINDTSKKSLENPYTINAKSMKSLEHQRKINHNYWNPTENQWNHLEIENIINCKAIEKPLIIDRQYPNIEDKSTKTDWMGHLANLRKNIKE